MRERMRAHEGLSAVKVAARLQDALSGYRAAHRMDPSEYPSRQRGFHTMEDLDKMLKAKLAKEAAAPAYAGRF